MVESIKNGTSKLDGREQMMNHTASEGSDSPLKLRALSLNWYSSPVLRPTLVNCKTLGKLSPL